MNVNKQVKHSPENIETGGQIVGDGSIIDLVRGDKGNIELVVWDGSTATISAKIDRNGKRFIAPRAEENIATLVPFPSGVKNYGETREPIDLAVPFFSPNIAAYRTNPSRCWRTWRWAPWFPECSTIWPCVSIVTSDAAASTSLLALSALCGLRRPLHLGELTMNTLLSLPNWLRPTILIDQLVPSRELEGTLRR